MYLKFFSISIVLILKNIIISILEKNSILIVSIIEKLKTSVLKKKNIVKVFAEVITLRKFNKKEFDIFHC